MFKRFILPIILVLVLFSGLVSYLLFSGLHLKDALLIGLSVCVVVMEIVILYMMYHEYQERLTLQQHLADTRKALGRENYLLLIREGIEKAKSRVFFTTTSMTTPEEEPLMAEIIASAKKKHQFNAQFDHRGIVVEDARTIKGAYLLHQEASIKIKFHSGLNLSSFRFVIVDDNVSILAIGKPGMKSHMAYEIESTTLNGSLADTFEKIWNSSSAKDLSHFIKEVSSSMASLSKSEKAKRIGVPEDQI